jgi:hypothetical protein
MKMRDPPLWLQALVSTASSVGFGGALMVTTGFLLWAFDLPLFPNTLPGSFIALGIILGGIGSIVFVWDREDHGNDESQHQERSPA